MDEWMGSLTRYKYHRYFDLVLNLVPWDQEHGLGCRKATREEEENNKQIKNIT